jgi:hypothetical protein
MKKSIKVFIGLLRKYPHLGIVSSLDKINELNLDDKYVYKFIKNLPAYLITNNRSLHTHERLWLADQIEEKLRIKYVR